MIWLKYKAYGVQVLSMGCNASADCTYAWWRNHQLTCPVLSDTGGHVTLTYDPYLMLPWDATLSTSNTLSLTEIGSAFPDTFTIYLVIDSLLYPQPVADPNELNFGQVPLQTDTSKTIVVSNTSTGVIVPLGITFNHSVFSAEYSPTDSAFAVSVPAQNRDTTLTITVHFQPDQASEYQDTLKLAYHRNRFISRPDTLRVPIQGNGVAAVGPDAGLPLAFSLRTYPNPFNPELNVRITLPRAQDVAVDLYTIAGTHLAALHQGRLAPGIHQMTWAAQNSPSGIYLLKVRGNDWQEIRKVALVR